MEVSKNLEQNIAYMECVFPIEKSFDIITRTYNLGGREAFFIGLSGLCKASMLQKILENLEPPETELQAEPGEAAQGKGQTATEDAAQGKGQTAPEDAAQGKVQTAPENAAQGKVQIAPENAAQQLESYVERRIGYIQTKLEASMEQVLQNILSGMAVFFVDGYEKALVLDVRSYPERSCEEPDTEQVMLGPKDGFVENIIMNTNLIRRRIRSPKLVFELLGVGEAYSTDVAMVYLENQADEKLILKTREALKQLKISALSMGSKSLEEVLVKKSWLHPLPVIQTTARPDTACNYLLEGHLLLVVDNSPVVLILPCNIFQFTQNIEDYYKSPLVGTYFRLIRFGCMLIALFLLPVFLLLVTSYPEFAKSISLIKSEDISALEIFIYVLAMEFGLDLFRYSSLHSASRYAGPLSIIGGLIAGDVAIQLNWASSETVFYAAITLLSSIALSSIEFSEGIRIYRLFLLLLTGAMGLAGYGIIGFVLGTVLILISIITTPNFGGYGYLWPLFPLEWKALRTLLFRYPTYKAQNKS